LEFRDPSGTYALEYYNDAAALGTGQSVSVASGQAVSNINVALSNGASISGRVTAQTGGAVLEGIQVEVYRYDTSPGYWSSLWTGNTVFTDSLGNYTVRGLPAGSYRLEFRDPSGTYAQEYYNDAVTVETGQSVSVASGQAVSNINVALSNGATISGKVTAQTGGAAIEGVTVEIYRYVPGLGVWIPVWTGRDTMTDELGNYTLRGLAPGAYRVGFRDSSGAYAQEFHSDAIYPEQGTSINLAVGQNLVGVNAALSNAATISGRITAQTGGASLEGVQVEVYRYDFKQDYWSSLWMLATSTGPSGDYVIRGLPAGTYRLGFWDSNGKYAQEFYSNALNVETAQDFPLAEGQSLTGVDAALSQAASISGTVTADSTGAPLAGVRVGLFSYDPVAATWNYHWIGAAPVTDELGRYVISGLGPGTYRVGFQEANLEYGMEFYANAGSAETATNVTVGTGSQVDGIDVSLGKATKISGTVTTKSGGAPLPGVVVAIYRYEASVGEWNYVETFRNFTTDALGNYSIPGLPPGTYSLEFRDTKDVYATQFYSNSPSTAAATSISLTPGQELVDLNVALVDGGSISGLVVKEGGTSPLKGALVKAHLLVNGLWHEVWQQRELSGQNGAFSIVGLAPGTYRLEITDLSRQYATEFYLNANSFASATSIQLNTGEDRSVGTVVMGAAASFSGAITGPDGATPLQGVSVVPHRWNQSSQVWEPLASTRTQTNGAFKLEGLAPGTYTFEFVDQSDVYLGEFFNNAPNLTAATRIELQPGQKFQGAQISLALAGYDVWKASYGVTGSQTSDDDKDGLSNGAEYALGTHPRQVDANKALAFRTSGSSLVLEFLKRNHGANSVLQETIDLRNGSWSASQATVSESPDQIGVAVGYTRMRCVVPATGRKFFRVLATY
jgi:protocatechuate 3,4-dioxygenase beta subunit